MGIKSFNYMGVFSSHQEEVVATAFFQESNYIHAHTKDSTSPHQVVYFSSAESAIL